MKYYTDKLYPFQDKIVQIVQSCATKFYLTGGTVLCRKYLQHRYSDDLDFTSDIEIIANDILHGNDNSLVSVLLLLGNSGVS